MLHRRETVYQTDGFLRPLTARAAIPPVPGIFFPAHIQLPALHKYIPAPDSAFAADMPARDQSVKRRRYSP